MMKLLIFVCLFFAQFVHAAEIPAFTLRDMDGNLFRSSEWVGKGPVVLDFWATWCKPCVKSLPHLQKLYGTYKDQGLVVVGINEDGPRSLSKVQPFATSLGLTFPVLIDENRDLVRKLRITGFPTTLLIDKNGREVMRINGYRPGDEETLRKKISALLEETE